ncbi:hemagglutinin repeat-containing protein, partial [Pluralibacter sp.]|uniref:hemagglutinin repeat-containing protein n=1 Tax=Pluralibacter sp. TaxID=1920032 RepID=UPI0025E950D2
NTSALTGKNESKGGTVGIGIGAGSGGWGIQISASVNKASGKETGNGLTPTESASQTVRAYWMAYLKIRKEKGPR